MKICITMLLAASLMVVGAVPAVAADAFIGSVESAPVTTTEIIGSDGQGNTFVAKGNDGTGSDVFITGESTTIINVAYADVAELDEEHKAVILEAKAALEASQKEILENARDLTALIPELKAEEQKPGDTPVQQPQYAVSRHEAVVSYGEDAKQMERIIEAKEEMTIGLNKDFDYSKAEGDKIAIKFANGQWRVIPQRDIHFDETGHLTISFIPESVSYEIMLVKEVRAGQQSQEEKENKKHYFVRGVKALKGKKARSAVGR